MLQVKTNNFEYKEDKITMQILNLRDLSEISKRGRGGGDFQLSDENKMTLPR